MEQKDEKRPAFGNRFLNDESNVFKHNAWDNVEWSEEQENDAELITKKQAMESIPTDEQVQFLEQAFANWDKFYQKHDNKFFKDRHWLFTEFPELLLEKSEDIDKTTYESTEITPCEYPGQNAKYKFLEIGCGAGNTIFPVLASNNTNDLFMYGCDYSKTAVNIVKSHHDYDEKRCHVFVHDITASNEFPVPAESLDIVVMIFVLSALQYESMANSISKITKLLKPGGVVLFRDYGRYDMAQLRFKKGRCLSENFYTRGDGTLVYFFKQDEIRELFTSSGLVEEQNVIDRRLQVNRARQLKMYRVWIQAKYRKPL